MQVLRGYAWIYTEAQLISGKRKSFQAELFSLSQVHHHLGEKSVYWVHLKWYSESVTPQKGRSWMDPKAPCLLWVGLWAALDSKVGKKLNGFLDPP